jgi:leucyl-tRNA synthetase
MYMMFMGPPELDCEWQDAGLEGVKRFMNRLWNWLAEKTTMVDDAHETVEAKRCVHAFLKTYQERLALFKPNTALSAFMEFLNTMQEKRLSVGKTSMELILVSLSVLAPYAASELLEKLLHKQLRDCRWPKVDDNYAISDEVTIVIQISGRTRAQVGVHRDAKQEYVQEVAQAVAAKWLEGVRIVKVIYVPNRLSNFVVAP